MNSPIHLHAIVVERPGNVLEARLCELNIAVAGTTPDQLLREFSHAINAHYEIAIDNHLTPFANLCLHRQEGLLDAPHLFEELGVMDLPAHVAMALAIALHSPAPTAPHLRWLKKAA